MQSFSRYTQNRVDEIANYANYEQNIKYHSNCNSIAKE